MNLKELRKSRSLTQAECANKLGISLRSYQMYENSNDKMNTLKYNYIVDRLNQLYPLDEDHGVLTLDQIKIKCAEVFENYQVDFCYLFGSYAKGKATDQSDVDLLVSTSITGIRFFGLVEALREALNKRVDLLDLAQLSANPELIAEILKDGIKIYG